MAIYDPFVFAVVLRTPAVWYIIYYTLPLSVVIHSASLIGPMCRGH